MVPLYGRAPKGQRCWAAVPHGHSKTTTFTAGLRINGMAAPMVLDGPMNGHVFLAYVRQALVPELTRGDVVIVDNLTSHKVAGVRDAVKAAGADLIYLPPYSPDFNLIEMAFSKLKALVRQRGEDNSRPMASHRRCHQTVRTRRMPKLLPSRRI